MFGLGVTLVKIFNYLQSRKYKKCICCNKYFKNKIDLDNHIRKEHNSTSETGTINREEKNEIVNESINIPFFTL